MTKRGPTWTQQHLRACLIRWIAQLPKAQRQAFYGMWEARHGKPSALALVEDVKKAHRSTSAS